MSKEHCTLMKLITSLTVGRWESCMGNLHRLSPWCLNVLFTHTSCWTMIVLPLLRNVTSQYICNLQCKWWICLCLVRCIIVLYGSLMKRWHHSFPLLKCFFLWYFWAKLEVFNHSREFLTMDEPSHVVHIKRVCSKLICLAVKESTKNRRF